MAIKMQMTNAEILKSYNEAKHKGKQIEILSDLNACPKQLIVDILIAEGVDPRSFSRFKGENLVKKVKGEVKAHEAKKAKEDEAAVILEAVTLLRDKLDAEYKKLEAEWASISAEYERKLVILDRMVGCDGQRAD